MNKRPYVVRNIETGKVGLVNASNKSQAVRCIADAIIECHAASGSEVAALMGKGIPLIESGEHVEQEELPGVADSGGGGMSPAAAEQFGQQASQIAGQMAGSGFAAYPFGEPGDSDRSPV